jgi:hypothetical protein
MDVERRGAAVVGWLIGVAGALRLLPLARLHPIVWDEVEYFRATDWVSRGLVPYRDFWEHHTPLQWFVFAPIAAMTSSPGVNAILAMRWAQLPLWIVTFVLLAKWMRREGASARATLVAILCAVCSTLFTLGAIEYRIDALGCALYVAGLYFGGWRGGAALCLAGFANIRLGPLIVLTLLLSRERGRAIGGAAMTFAFCSLYFLITNSAAIAFRRVWTENYLADKLTPGPAWSMLRRLAAPFGFVGGAFDPAAVDFGTIVIFIAGIAGMALKRDRLVILQVASIAFIASMKFVHHYHFLIVILLALPFVAHVVDRLPWRAVATVMAVAVAVSAFASVFRGKEDDLDYQDVIMREVHQNTPPGGRVFDGVGYAIRREPAYRYWFLAQLVRVLEARQIFEPYDIAADPPDAVIASVPTRLWLADHPRQAEFVARHFRPVWPELWLPAMNARLTPARPTMRWIVPADGTYVVRGPVPLRLAIDGNPQPPSGTLTLRKRQRLEAAAEIMEPTDILIVPASAPRAFRRPAPGVTLDAVTPPRTHVPRLW